MSQDVDGAPSGPRVCPQCSTQYAADIRFCPVDGWALRAPAGDSNLVGEVIDDRYLIVSKLGEGGMGQVYRAEHVALPKEYAIKVMNPHLLHDVDAAGRFGREARNSCRIVHPNVAAVYDYGETSQGITYIVMEYVDGEPLSQLLRRESPLAPPRAVAIARQLADALAAAHELGIVHRDLKPENVMVTRVHGRRDVIKLVDFGIARAIADDQRLTRTGLVVGTPAYMSPEQTKGLPLDGRSDIYSLGCILHEMLTGEQPVASPSGEAPPPHPRQAKAYVPKVLDEAVAKAMARLPQDRFQTAEEFAAVLVIPQDESPAAARWPRAWSGLRDEIRRRQWPRAWSGVRDAMRGRTTTPEPAMAPPLSIEVIRAELITPVPDVESDPTHPVVVEGQIAELPVAEPVAADAPMNAPLVDAHVMNATEPPQSVPTEQAAVEPIVVEPLRPAPLSDERQAIGTMPTAPIPVMGAGATGERITSATGGQLGTTNTPTPVEPSVPAAASRRRSTLLGAGAAAALLALAIVLWPRDGATRQRDGGPPAGPTADSLRLVLGRDSTKARGTDSGTKAPGTELTGTIIDTTSVPIVHSAYQFARDSALVIRKLAEQQGASKRELAPGDAFLRVADSLAALPVPDTAGARKRRVSANRSWTKAGADASARLDLAKQESAKREDVAAIGQVVVGYVDAIGARDMRAMERRFPTIPSGTKEILQGQFDHATSAWTAKILDRDPAIVNADGTSAQVRFRYRWGEGSVLPEANVVATLQRGAKGWQIERVEATP